MRPGLWVGLRFARRMPAVVEDSDLKLSYDLYYVHFSTWLDIVILLRTVQLASRPEVEILSPLYFTCFVLTITLFRATIALQEFSKFDYTVCYST